MAFVYLIPNRHPKRPLFLLIFFLLPFTYLVNFGLVNEVSAWTAYLIFIMLISIFFSRLISAIIMFFLPLYKLQIEYPSLQKIKLEYRSHRKSPFQFIEFDMRMGDISYSNNQINLIGRIDEDFVFIVLLNIFVSRRNRGYIEGVQKNSNILKIIQNDIEIKSFYLLDFHELKSAEIENFKYNKRLSFDFDITKFDVSKFQKTPTIAIPDLSIN